MNLSDEATQSLWFQIESAAYSAIAKSTMSNTFDIYCEHNPSPAKLEVLGVYDWPVWSKEVSKFPWTYKDQESCYIIKGRIIVTPDGGEPQEFKRGDFITFPQGLSCHWQVVEAVEKYYRFG
jgi:uncharacterized cupin superfamily protein